MSLKAATLSLFVLVVLLVVQCFTQSCPIYEQPIGSANLTGSEKLCGFNLPLISQRCSACCNETNTVCCDDGSCMPYDMYCRYPDNCCKEKYCGDQCCPSSYGVPCGPYCAPLQNTQCCDANKGVLCGKDDQCCGDTCCPKSMKCCGDHCCPPDGPCDDNPNEGCCPDNQICGRKKLTSDEKQDKETIELALVEPEQATTETCCPDGTICQDNVGCCPQRSKWCPGGSITNCFADTTVACCQNGNACPGTHPVCVFHDGILGSVTKCCPEGYSQTCNGQCFPSNCGCCGNKLCCASGHVCRDSICQWCREVGWWIFCHEKCTGQDDGAGTASVEQFLSHSIETGVSQFLRYIRHGKNSHKADSPQDPSASNKTHETFTLPPYTGVKINPKLYPCFSVSGGLQWLKTQKDHVTLLTNVPAAYDCMEEIAQCGESGVIRRQEQFIWYGFNSAWPSFDHDGKDFLNCTQTCTVREALNMFQDGVKPCCKAIENYDSDLARSGCFRTCGYCNIYASNAGALKKLFQQLDEGANPTVVYGEICG